MKKAARIFFITAGVFVAIIAIAIIVLFQPSVQTWLARKVAAGQPGLDITIGRVDAGLNKVEITGVRVKGPGLVVDLPQATIEIPLMGLIRENVDIRRLAARGWTVDLSQPAPATPAPAPAPDGKTPPPGANGSGTFNGIFEMLRLPVNLTIDDADIEGTVILPPQNPGDAPTRAGVSVRGGQLRPGNDGRFDIAFNAQLPGNDAPVSNIQMTGKLAVRMGTPREIQSLSFDADAKASGGQLPQGARLQFNVGASQNATGEDYVVSLKSQGSDSEKNLLKVKATNPAGPEGLNAMWTIDLRDSDLAPFTAGLGLKLPALTASGQGTFATNDDFNSFHAAGKLFADVSGLDVLVASLSALGRVNLSADFDVMSEGDLLRIGVLSADIVSTSPVASVKTLQLIEINTATGAIKVPNLQSDLVRVDIHGLPLAWAEPFLKDAGVSISGGPLRGSVTGRAQGEGYSLRSAAPITLDGLAASQDGKELARDLDISTGFSADYSNAAWAFNVSDLSIRSHGATLVEIPAARAGGPLPAPAKGGSLVTAEGRMRANLPPLLAQPAAAGLCALDAGSVDLDFSGNIKEGVTALAAKITTAGLRAAGKNLPKISADVRADLHDNGECEVEAPMVFELNGRKSDIQLGATLKPDGARQHIDASIAGDELYIEDMMTFTALVPSNTEAPATQPPASPEPQPGAPWDGIGGQVKFLLKKVVYSPEIQTINNAGSFEITPSMFSLVNLRASTHDGAEIKANGSVKYDAASKTSAYVADGKLALANFDPGPFLRAANPGGKPTVEGKFDINSTVSGTSASLVEIADAANADLTLTSRGGKFHGFAASARSSNIEQLQKTVSTIGAIGGAVLSIVGKSDTSGAPEKYQAGTRILDRLVEINFDQINLEAAYRAGQDTVIKNFSLLSPDMRISGAGSLGNVPALSVLKQELSMNLQMAARGDQAKDLQTVNVLKKEPDSLGYVPLLKDFAVEGSLSSLTSTALVKQITAALATK